MADNPEQLAAANPPVATQSAPQSTSIYDGLRVKLAQAGNLGMTLVGGGITPAKQVENASALQQKAQDTATDPKQRTNFLMGLAGPGDLGEGFSAEGLREGATELEGEAKKIYEGLRVRKAQPDPAALAKDAGLVYKDEAMKGSGVHQFEHPDHPGQTMAVREKDLTTPEALKSRMDAKVEEFKPKTSPKTSPNASGESSASQEAINRTSAEKSKGLQRIKIDTRSGKETPLSGVDAVDVHPQAHEVVVQRGPDGETLLDKGEKARYIPKKLRQDLSPAESMDDPDTRFNTARHEAGHAVVSELLRPNSVQEVGLDDGGGYTNISPPAGKTDTSQLSPEEIKNMVAVSYAGGMSEPGGTTAKHVGPDQTRRADILMGGADSMAANLGRLLTGKTLGQDKFLQANQSQADAKARVNALLADPQNRAKIDELATKITSKGKLSGDDVRKSLGSKK